MRLCPISFNVKYIIDFIVNLCIIYINKKWNNKLSMKNTLFENLSSEELSKIKKSFVKLNFSEKDLVYSANERSNSAFISNKNTDSDIWIYFIQYWSIKISVTKEWKKNTIAFLKKWDFFWEVSSILNFKPTAEVLALSDAEINFIDLTQFNKLLMEIPTFSINLCKYLAKRIQFQSSIIFDHVFRPLESRVASTILNLANEFWKKMKTWKISIPIRITHQDLADFVWTNRETITKILTRFKNNKIISFAKKKITIENLKKIQEDGR